MSGLLLSFAVSAGALRSWLASMLLACGLLLAGVLSTRAVAAPPELKLQSAGLHSEHTPPGAAVSAEAPGHARTPKSIYHIPKYRSTVGVFNSPFVSPTVEGGVHNHHGPICEKYSGTECTKYYEGKLYYRGGEVLKEPKLYLIFYGSNWTKNEENKKWKGALLNTLRGMTTEYAFDETYQRILHQYWDEQTEPKQISNTMTVGGEWTYEGAEAPQNLTEENVELEVNQAIETNHWARAKNAVFMVMEPIGSAWNEKFAEETQCGYHYTDRWADVYALIPNDNDRHFNSGCVINSIQRTETETATHEYAEAVTDPHPREGETPGWTNNQGYEIADICDAEPEMLNETLGIYVSALWGNAEKTCVIHDPPENPPVSPTSTTEGTTGVSFHQATLTGSVNPNGGPEPRYYFEYGTTTGYGSYVPAPPGSGLGSRGESSVPVSATPTGLKVGTTYHYRLVASTWAGTGYGADKEVTTLIPPPVATTEPATHIGDSHVTLTGLVNPEESSTAYQFEYWPTHKPTEVTKIPTSAEPVGSGTSNVKVSQSVIGLSHYTEYSYRLVATNPGGTTKGSEATFITGPFTEVISTPNPSGGIENVLQGMSCSSTSACMTVGSYKNSSGTQVTLGERWNGTEWSIQSTPNPSGASLSYLHGVSCPSATLCLAVGQYKNSSGTLVTLAERWNGTEWTVQSTPNPSGATSSWLYGVSCPSTTVCTAVGSYQTSGGAIDSLGERWNGTEWTIQSMPNTALSTNLVNAVSCFSANSCTAVGGTTTEPYIARWNGTEWVIQKGVDKSTRNPLDAVSCPTEKSCIAVGAYAEGLFGGGPWFGLAEVWNGTEWSLQSVPNPSGAKGSSLAGLVCTSATSCTATGDYENSAGVTTTLAGGLSGTEWKVQGSPNPTGGTADELTGVWCSASLVCTATGHYVNSSGTELTLGESAE